MSFYQDMQKVASSVLKQFKQGSVKLYQYTETAGGSLDAPAELTENIYELDATVSGVDYNYLIDNYAVATDLTVTASVIPGVYPTINDFVEINGERHKIVRDVSPAPYAVEGSGQPVVWRFICRKG